MKNNTEKTQKNKHSENIIKNIDKIIELVLKRNNLIKERKEFKECGPFYNKRIREINKEIKSLK